MHFTLYFFLLNSTERCVIMGAQITMLLVHRSTCLRKKGELRTYHFERSNSISVTKKLMIPNHSFSILQHPAAALCVIIVGQGHGGIKR
jgi:hypothetical protein